MGRAHRAFLLKVLQPPGSVPYSKVTKSFGKSIPVAQSRILQLRFAVKTFGMLEDQTFRFSNALALTTRAQGPTGPDPDGANRGLHADFLNNQHNGQLTTYGLRLNDTAIPTSSLSSLASTITCSGNISN